MRLPDWPLSAPQRVQIAVGAVLAVAAANAYLLGKDVARLIDPGDEVEWEVAPYLQALAPVAAQVPPDARVGFVSDQVGETLQRRDLFLSRYALTPRCVVDGDDAPFVLTHGDTPPRGPAWQLIAELSSGFRLYRSTAPR